jgi:hypothetical protein
MRWVSRPRDLLDPSAAVAAGHCSANCSAPALDHYEVGWHYTSRFRAPKRGCGSRVPGRSSSGSARSISSPRSPNWLDPSLTLKVPRVRVYGLMAHSLATVWSTRALGRQARQLRASIARAV